MNRMGSERGQESLLDRRHIHHQARQPRGVAVEQADSQFGSSVRVCEKEREREN